MGLGFGVEGLELDVLERGPIGLCRGFIWVTGMVLLGSIRVLLGFRVQAEVEGEVESEFRVSKGVY